MAAGTPASSSALSLQAVTPQGIALSGANPAMVLVDDTGVLYNARTNARLSDALYGPVTVRYSNDPLNEPLKILVHGGSDLSPCIAQYMSIGTNVARGSSTALNLIARAGTGDSTDANLRAGPALRVLRGTLINSDTAGASELATGVSAAFMDTALKVAAGVTHAGPGAYTTISRLFLTGFAGARFTGTLYSSALLEVNLNGPGQYDNVRGISVSVTENATAGSVPFSGTISRLTAIQARPANFISGGSAGVIEALRIFGPTDSPALAVTSRSYGLNVESVEPNGAPFAAGVRIASQPNGTRALWFDSNENNSRGGIAWGTTPDTSIYRGAAGIIETGGDFRCDHLRCLRTPTVAAGPGAGTAPTVTLSGRDMAFAVTVVQGNPSAAGVIFTVTFGKTWTNAPHAAMSFRNAAAAALGNQSPYVTTTATELILNSGAAPLVAGTTYSWGFVVGPGN